MWQVCTEIHRKKALTLHIKGVHEKIKEFNCDRCNKKFSKGYNLKVHVQTVHEKEKKLYLQNLPEHIANNFEIFFTDMPSYIFYLNEII